MQLQYILRRAGAVLLTVFLLTICLVSEFRNRERDHGEYADGTPASFERMHTGLQLIGTLGRFFTKTQ